MQDQSSQKKLAFHHIVIYAHAKVTLQLHNRWETRPRPLRQFITLALLFPARFEQAANRRRPTARTLPLLKSCLSIRAQLRAGHDLLRSEHAVPRLEGARQGRDAPLPRACAPSRAFTRALGTVRDAERVLQRRSAYLSISAARLATCTGAHWHICTEDARRGFRTRKRIP
eukprot:6208849-Pleurochrysis_carterae.AAC.3